MSESQWVQIAKKIGKEKTNPFLYLPSTDQHPIIGAFCGEPFSYKSVWTLDSLELYNPQKHGEIETILRIRINFYLPNIGMMKILEGNVQWFRTLLEVRCKYSLDKWFFKVKRYNNSIENDMYYTILPEERISEIHLKKILALKLWDLEKLV